ncbi:Hint domain-containing protein [Aliiroseovarius sp. YM-037]|uniref:Hint domain-containing protein n=1 Tax=Aliiroseovarius sp. YM-037 TaxID=3341728 RepID=UPI003A80B40A
MISNFKPDSEDAYADKVRCFTFGTRILTVRGEAAIQALHVGDQVHTANHGLQGLFRQTSLRIYRAYLPDHDRRLLPPSKGTAKRG